MKRFLTAVGILTILIGLVLFAIFDLNWRTKDTLGLLVEVEEQLEEKDQAETLDLMTLLYDRWISHEDAMTHYVRHDQLDDISQLLERALALARYNDPTDLAADLAEARHHLEHLRTFDLPSIKE